MDSSSCVEEKLSREILRKFKLATEAEAKEDREIVCEEIFNDVTGSLDENAQAALSVSGKASFYLVLAPYYLKDHTAADTLLFFVKRLWGQPYVAPIYALLLHRWMLLRKDAGGLVQRQKHVGVLVFGARQLFLGDVNSSSAKFEPLFRFFAFEVAMGPDRGHLEQLPPTARSQLLATVASFLPYYCDPKELGELVAAMPSPLGHQQDGKAQASGEGADFTVAEITDILPEIKVEPGLVRYLLALSGLAGSEQVRCVRARTRIRLQSELYVLSLPGGPRYPPKLVRDAAMAALDSLFPMGRKSRRVVQLLFRLLHPTDWLGEFWLRPVRLATWLYVRCVLVVLRAMVGVPVKVYGAMGRRRG